MENENIKELENLNSKVKEWNNAKCSPAQLAEELEQILKDMSTKYFGNNLHANEIYMYLDIINNLDIGEFTEQEINELSKYIYDIWLKFDILNIQNITDTVLELSKEMTAEKITQMSCSDFIDNVLF